MRNKKATGDNDDVPGDVLIILGAVGMKIMRKLINTIMKLESGLRSSQNYNDCLQEKTTRYKMQRPSHIQQR